MRDDDKDVRLRRGRLLDRDQLGQHALLVPGGPQAVLYFKEVLDQREMRQV